MRARILTTRIMQYRIIVFSPAIRGRTTARPTAAAGGGRVTPPWTTKRTRTRVGRDRGCRCALFPASGSVDRRPPRRHVSSWPLFFSRLPGSRCWARFRDSDNMTTAVIYRVAIRGPRARRSKRSPAGPVLLFYNIMLAGMCIVIFKPYLK